MRYSFLEPVQVGPFTLRNRIIKPAMAEYVCHADGTVSDQFVEFYRTMARGGVALIVPGICVLDDTVTDLPTYSGNRNPHLYDERFIPGLKKAVDAVHEEGALIMFQLWHSGAVATEGGLRSKIGDFTKEELKALQEKYIRAAEIVKKAGADGVEFHMAHTYIASQFLSPYFNCRTDEYGSASVEDATRFAAEIIRRIHEELCDDGFTVIVKLQGDDFVEGGVTPERAGEAAAILEKCGASLFTVNGGGALTGYQFMSDNGHQPEGWKVHIAETVKQYVSVPVAASGNIRHPDYAHQLVRDGRCDLVAMGRTLLADPDWVRKTQEGRENELRYCISCVYCFTPVPDDDSVPGCSVNPYCKCERSKPVLRRDGAGRKVVVAGAGPAGMEAAVVLAERGFDVTLLEKNPYLGGLLDLAAVPPHKQKLAWLIDYYARQLRRLHVDVRLSTEATADAVKAYSPYAVFVATGTDEVFPESIPGIRDASVLRVRGVLDERMPIDGENIAVIGGGLTGVETAHLLSLKGHRVRVIEMLPEKPLPVAEKLSFADAVRDGVELLYEHRLLAVEQGAVRVKDLKENTEKEIAADKVILSMGISPRVSLYEELKDSLERVTKIGDCDRPGKIPHAIRSGAEAAYALP